MYGEEQENPPELTDSQLTLDLVTKGLNSSNMAFLGLNDILALDGSNGKVYRITNGTLLKQPLVDLNAFHQDGLIGIAIANNKDAPPYVYLYLNESPAEYGKDVKNRTEAIMLNKTLGFDREGDKLYRFKLVNNQLVEPKVLFELKAPRPSNNPGVMHHGGETIIGPDGAIYLVIGELQGSKFGVKTEAQNYKGGKEPDGRSGILRMTQDGKALGNGILGDTYPLSLYYAYGIRNSYGMDFDPLTGKLWNTENGPDYGDEINLVEPGFNSGTDIVWGMPNAGDDLGDLVTFNGKGKYSDPKFVWTDTVGPTALKFLNSDKLGKQYENDIFVGDFNNGNIYHFDLTENRTELALSGPLEDKVADNQTELANIIFGKNFGPITDMEVGPDGYLYVGAHGKIFRIHPVND